MSEPVTPGRAASRAAGLRVATELIAWVAAPWALWGHSIPLALASPVVLIGLPAVFATPGDKPNAPLVAVPGAVTVGFVLLEVGAAVAAGWAVWPAPVAVARR